MIEIWDDRVLICGEEVPAFYSKLESFIEFERYDDIVRLIECSRPVATLSLENLDNKYLPYLNTYLIEELLTSLGAKIERVYFSEIGEPFYKMITEIKSTIGVKCEMKQCDRLWSIGTLSSPYTEEFRLDIIIHSSLLMDDDISYNTQIFLRREGIFFLDNICSLDYYHDKCVKYKISLGKNEGRSYHPSEMNLTIYLLEYLVNHFLNSCKALDISVEGLIE